MLKKWIRVSKDAQKRYNRICHIWSVKPRNFHFERSKMYSQERKFLRAICEAFPDANITASFTNLRSTDKANRRFDVDLSCHNTEINRRVYIRHVNITYYLNDNYVWLSYKTIKAFKIREYNYKNISSIKPIINHIKKSLAEIEFC